MIKDRLYRVTTLQAALTNVEIQAKHHHNNLVCYLNRQSTMLSEDLVNVFNTELFKHYRIKNIITPLYKKLSFVTIDTITEINLRAKIRNLFSFSASDTDIQKLLDYIIISINHYYDQYSKYNIEHINDIQMKVYYD